MGELLVASDVGGTFTDTVTIDGDDVVRRFIETYEARLGEGSAFSAAGVEMTTFRVVARAPSRKPALAGAPQADGAAPGERQVFGDGSGGPRPCCVSWARASSSTGWRSSSCPTPGRIVRRGETNRELWDVVIANSRMPFTVSNDFTAFLAGLKVAGERMTELCDL